MKKLFNILLLVVIVAPLGVSQDVGIDIWTTNTTTVGRVFGMVNDPSDQNIMYACGLDEGVNKTTDGGITWNQFNTGLLNIGVQAIAICTGSPQNLYVGTGVGANAGVYKTTNGGTSWTQVNTGISEAIAIQAVMVHPTNPNIAWCANFNGTADAVNGLYKTTDGGANWFVITTGIGAIKNFLSLAMSPTDPNTIYAGSSFMVATSMGPSAIYKSTDGGANWFLSSTGLPTDPAEINPVRTMQVSTANPNVVIAGLFMNTLNGGFYVSTDAGANWTKKHTGLPVDVGTLIRSCAIRPLFDNQFYVGLDRATLLNIGVWATTDGGDTWTTFNNGTMLDTYGIRGLLFNSTANHTLYAGCGSAVGQGVYEYQFSIVPVELVSFSAEVYSSDVTLSWITATEVNNYGFEIERRSSETGQWLNIGFVNGSGTSTEIRYYSFNDNSLSVGKYYYRLKQIDFDGNYTYSNEVEVNIIPVNEFALMQNYPNPFNPGTKIAFSIPNSSFVSLKVYDVLGNEIRTLINNDLREGSYEVEFTATELPSGVYFYNLTAGGFSQTLKMNLLK